MSEVGSLVTELGVLPEKTKRRSSQLHRRTSGLVNVTRSPERKDWKNRETICGVVAGDRQLEEGRLPVIVEGKHYPRKTLENLEISHLLGNNTSASESPELGPPPVAHFDAAEPINFAPPPTPAGSTAEIENGNQDHEDDIKPLPENLERRRRRRASALLEDMPTLKAPAMEIPDAAELSISLKSGAKRKLDVREQGYKEEPAPSELDDFAFRRKAVASETPPCRSKGTRFTKSGTGSTTSSAGTNHLASELEPETRKVLAPKSTNSPTKCKRPGNSDKIVSEQNEPAKRTKAQEYVEHKDPQIPAADRSCHVMPPKVNDLVTPQEPDATELPPKTPVEVDFFSPVSIEPSAKGGLQTEIALTASVEDVLGADGRTSRRARGAVSYAEPSLRAKMRRPTKELVAAVVEQTNCPKAQQRELGGRAESQERKVSQDLKAIQVRTVTIKSEKPGDDFSAWKDLPQEEEEPTSPLGQKVVRSALRKPPPEIKLEPENSGDSNTNAQLLEVGLESLSVSDGPEGSPDDVPNTTGVESRETPRRRSSNPESLRRVGQEFQRPAAPSGRPQARKVTAETSNRPSRPSSAASLRRENSSRDEKMGMKRSASVTTIKSSGGMNNAQGSGVASEAVAGKTERAAARRRSMMS